MKQIKKFLHKARFIKGKIDFMGTNIIKHKEGFGERYTNKTGGFYVNPNTGLIVFNFPTYREEFPEGDGYGNGNASAYGNYSEACKEIGNGSGYMVGGEGGWGDGTGGR